MSYVGERRGSDGHEAGSGGRTRRLTGLLPVVTWRHRSHAWMGIWWTVGVRVAIKDGVAGAPLARARGTDVVVADPPGWRTLGSPVRTDGVESG